MEDQKDLGGRPTKYLPEYCEKLIDHMKDGLSYETFGVTVGVCRRTVYDWETQFPEFLHAKKKAFDACQLTWERIGMAQALGDKEKGKGSPATWIFNMKNRFGWVNQDRPIDFEQDDIEWDTD